jgi:hypothetical protein
MGLDATVFVQGDIPAGLPIVAAEATAGIAQSSEAAIIQCYSRSGGEVLLLRHAHLSTEL